MNLHQQFLQLARQKNQIQYQLLQLLPEIYKSGIYKKYANTIEGYAMRFAQLPESTVRKRLNLEKHLTNKPALRKAIAKVGVHKVALVARIATPENEEIFVEKLRTMSKPAVQQLSKELRNKPNNKTFTLKLTPNLQNLWDQTKKKLGPDLTDEQILEQLLIQQKSPGRTFTTKSLSQKQKQQTKEVYKNKCAYPRCRKESEEVHHPGRNGDHSDLRPLCKIHHQFMHHGLVKNETKQPHKWQLQIRKTTNQTDLLYQKYRK
jgi:hypothetical protein